MTVEFSNGEVEIQLNDGTKFTLIEIYEGPVKNKLCLSLNDDAQQLSLEPIVHNTVYLSKKV